MDRSVYEARWILIVMLMLVTGVISAGICADTGGSPQIKSARIIASAGEKPASIVLAWDPASRFDR